MPDQEPLAAEIALIRADLDSIKTLLDKQHNLKRPTRWLSDREIANRLGYKDTLVLWRLRKEGKLSKPVKLRNKNRTREDIAEADIARIMGGAA
jgi:predicted DNA-binding transcriptional regulator AlpA